MTTESTQVGTLIVVILKARNLPNKRHLGKQTPYCSVRFNGETRRTKAIKRGGQHPEWDDEIRFTLYEDNPTASPTHGDGTPPPPPPKDGGVRKLKGGQSMYLACYADDPREPDLIGETNVDLTEVLTKGETDEWFTLNNKEKYCGEVYLELTFWSNAPAPQKKPTQVSQKIGKDYGGLGEFMPLTDDPHLNGDMRSYSESTISSSNTVSSKLNLYVPDYELSARGSPRQSSTDQLTNDFGELGVGDAARRSSTYPPVNGTYTGGSSLSSLPSSMSSNHYQQSERGSWYDGASDHRAVTPNGQRMHRLSESSSRPFTPYQVTYEQGPPPASSSFQGPPASSSFSYQPTPSRVGHRPRYSMPATSSGFMPVQPPADPSNFMRQAIPSHISDSNALGSPQEHSRMSMGYAPPLSHTPSPGRAPLPGHTPVPSSSFSTMPSRSPAPSALVSSASNAGYLHLSPSYTQGLQVALPQASGFAPTPPGSAPPGQYPPHPHQSTLPPIPHSAPPPQGFQPGPLPGQYMIPAHVPGSRPLPQPQGAPHVPVAPASRMYRVPSYSVPPPPPLNTEQHQGQAPPLPTPPGPPGPLAPISYSPTHTQSHPHSQPVTPASSFDGVPPPPPLSASPLPMPPSSRPSLPAPPPGPPPAQQPAYQPPLRRSSSYVQMGMQPSGSFQMQPSGSFVYPGPPPRPPQLLGPPQSSQWAPAHGGSN